MYRYLAWQMTLNSSSKYRSPLDRDFIHGKVDAPEGEKEMSLYREFNWGDYFRQFTLSNVIDQGKISAKMENGVLRLVLPKVEKTKPQKIKVAAG
jgi:HSP20 family protein